VGDTLNTEHGWIPVERIDDFHEILVDTFAPEASPHSRYGGPNAGTVKSGSLGSHKPWPYRAPLEFLQHGVSEMGLRSSAITCRVPEADE
jgi:hypothetical protein